jgi:hypothetical protein
VTIPEDVAYVGLLFTLFVVPRLLQRFGIPSALTAQVGVRVLDDGRRDLRPHHAPARRCCASRFPISMTSWSWGQNS